MAYPKNNLIIDIGNEQIKIADTIRSGEQIKIKDFVIIATPENCINDGVITDKVRLGTVLKSVIKDHKLRTKNTIFTVSSSKIITREVDFPDIKLAKLKPIVLMNASEYFPVNLNDYILDFCITDHIVVDNEKKVRVNIFAALSTMIEEYATLASLMQTKLIGIDFTGNSLTNFVKKEKIPGAKMILDIGGESTMVSIMVDGVSKFNRNLLFGTNSLLEYIMSHFEVDSGEAIRISRERALLTSVTDENPYLSNDVSSAMNQILNGVSRLMDYYTSRNQGRIDKIYIVGGGANINGIEEYIEKFFNIPTKKIVGFKSAVYKGSKNFSTAEIYLPNVIGAAFTEINLAPKSIAEKEIQQTKKRTSFLLVVLVAVALVAYYITLSNKNNTLERKKMQLTEDIAAAQEIQVIKSDYDALIKRVEFRQQIIDVSKSTSEQFTQVLEEMENTIPSNVFYMSLTDTGSALEINCIAKDKMTVAKFIESLKGMGFTDVFVPVITETGTEEDANSYVSFSVTCTY